MKVKTILSLTLMVALTGCAGSGRYWADAGGAAGGAALAHHLSDGNAAWTAGGAVAGVGLAEGGRALFNRAEQKAYQRGLEQGRSDAVKEIYWRQQQAHRPAPGVARTTLYPIQLPEQEVDGVIYQPSTQYLRIQR